MSDQKLIIGYYRLSMEDDSEGESNSIINQRKLVKDFFRFARNYIEMGTYLEQIFPFLGVRFMSISERYDSKDYIRKEFGYRSTV